MTRVAHVYSIDRVAQSIGECREPIEGVISDSDNIDHGEMIHVHDGTDEGITTSTDRGAECLQEFLADIRTREGGLRHFLTDQSCEPEIIERVMADETEA